MDDLSFTSASDLATMIRARKISPVEIVRDTLDRIEQTQSSLNAFITVCHERGMSEARAAEELVMRGGELSPLHGIPMSVKDLVPTAGIRTTYGSLIFSDHVPQTDAVAVSRMKNAGAIVVGKTTTPEFGQQCFTEAPLFGRTRNAWHAGRTSGGSSGGAAAAVASGLGPIAIASDGGGSTRIPAACNGLVGFKQGMGVVPMEYAHDGFANISYITPMTRTVLDTALMLDAMAGPDPRDPLSAARAQPSFAAAADPRHGVRGVRIAWRPRLGNIHVSSEVIAACEAALADLSSLGAHTSEHTAHFENPEAVWFVNSACYRMAQYGHHLEKNRDKMCPVFLRQLERIKNHSAAELYSAVFQRTALYRQVQSWFETTDILATPTLSRPALPIDQNFFEPIEIDGQKVPNIRAAWYPYTMPFNLTGNPAVSLPVGFDKEGLPIAIQLVAPCGQDAQLLKMAAALENARPWASKRPNTSTAGKSAAA